MSILTTYLESTGWRKYAAGLGEYRNVNLWDHPCHQHNERGGFTTTEAVAHQKEYEKNGHDDCIKENK